MPSDQLHSNPSIEFGDAVVFSERALYETYNFHDPGHVERLADWLARDERGDEPGVAVVAGQAGSGRDYVVRAAAWLAGKRGTRVRHVRLNFDGFDPDGKDAIAAFARHQMRMHLAPEEDDAASVVNKQALLADLVDRIPVTSLGAAVISFLLKTALSVVDARALLRSTVPVLSGPRPSGEERLRNLVDAATKDERLVLVLPADVMSEPAVQWFVHEPRRRRRLSVVLLMGSTPDATEIYGEPLAHVVEPRRIPQGSLRERVSHRFTPNTFPDLFFSGLWKRTQGVPGQVALAMMDLEHRELITRTDAPGRPWHLAVDPDDEALVEYFASQFYEQLNQFRNQQKPVDRHLLRFVELAALCGPIVPPRLIASYMGLTDAERDALLLRINRETDAGRPVFTSLEYEHPTFRNEQGEVELVYRFTDESNRLIVLSRMYPRAKEAHGLLQYLSAHLPMVTRGNAELFVTLARHLPERSDDRETYERMLRWWTDAAEADALAGLLSEQVRLGRIDPQVLWSAVEHYQEWPPARRLALLDAMQADPDGIPLAILPSYHYTRGVLLHRLGRVWDALQAVHLGIDSAGAGENAELYSLHYEAAVCCKLVGRLEDELWHCAEQYRLAPLVFPNGEVHVAAAASDFASALIRLGHEDRARPYVDEAYRIGVSLQSGEAEWHSAGILMNSLGGTFYRLGDYSRAVEAHRKALEWHARAGDNREPPDWRADICHYNLGSCLWRIGEIEEARWHLTRAMEMALDSSGTWDIAYCGSILKLLVLDLAQGDDDGVEERAAYLRRLLDSGELEAIGYLRDQAAELARVLPAITTGAARSDVRYIFATLLETSPGNHVAAE